MSVACMHIKNEKDRPDSGILSPVVAQRRAPPLALVGWEMMRDDERTEEEWRVEGQAGERRRVETREERQRRKMERGPPEEREGSLIFSAIDGLHRPTSQQDGVARPLRKCLSCAKVFGAYDLFGYEGHVCGVRGAAAHPKPPTYDGIG